MRKRGLRRRVIGPGVQVADVARWHGTTRWQIYDWRKQMRKGSLVLPESVAAVPGTAFGPSGEGFLRCCYATSMDDLKEAMIRLERYIGTLA